jgi:NADPH-dependent 2,4-dienoyl-CoA reductase/sulfur reductase-like enzyme
MAVTIIEENPALGGQYFRGRQASLMDGSPKTFRLRGGGETVLTDTVVFDAPMAGTISIWSAATGARMLPYDVLCLAVGAYDRPVAVPGWTLPGVLTAGGAHTLATAHRVRPGKRTIVAGAGPFLLPVAAELSRVGAQVTIIDAATLSDYAAGLGAVLANPSLIRQATGYASRLAVNRVRYRGGSLITGIHGSDRVESATVHKVDANWRPIPNSDRLIKADSVCLGFGFIPQVELAQVLGCAIRYQEKTSSSAVEVDPSMRTCVRGVYAAGEITGVAGLLSAIIEGRVAGLTAALDTGHVSQVVYDAEFRSLRARWRRLQRQTEWMDLHFAPRDGLWDIVRPDTIICRCEDVSEADISKALIGDPVDTGTVKSFTRAGMGLCQGRICNPYIVEYLRHTRNFAPSRLGLSWSVRPPVRPVPIDSWMSLYGTRSR